VSYDDIVNADQHPNDWLTFSGSYTSTRHSSLDQINRANVAQLATKWIYQFENAPPFIEASPLVHDGMMFVTTSPCTTYALDAATGKEIWRYTCTLASEAPSDVGAMNNRGVALLDDKVFVATWDDRLVALSAATGQVAWETVVSDDPAVYYISSAPLAINGMIVTGIATRKVGRGFIAAYSAETGEQVWRFEAIPGPGEPGNETWAGDSWRTGGAPTWLTGSYDADADLLYWGIGNPKPDYDPDLRRGDNLYTDSVVALRGSTGELLWYFQFTPGDDKDWDASQIPILVDSENGDSTKRMLWANSNGFYYVLDRLSGKFLVGTPFAQQNWAAALDANGRPVPARSTRALQGDLLYPGNGGATNWWPATYYPPLDLMIVPTLEQGMVYFPSTNSPPRGSGKSFYTAVRALDADTGKLVWEHRQDPRFVDNWTGGLLSTRGGLVFAGDQMNFFALSADRGELLWSVGTGGNMFAAPVTYAVDGQQIVAVAAGGDLLAFSLPRAEAISGHAPN